MFNRRQFVTWIAMGLLALGVVTPGTASASQKLKVVVTSSAYKAIADYIGGDKVDVSYIVKGNQDPHIVRPKPSLAVALNEADVFVATGMDLEMWAPALVDMSNNSKIRSGQVGYVSASAGLDIIEKPITVSRAEGDVHIYGNPHIHTSPLNGKTIAENICVGFTRNAPQHREYFEKRLKAFKKEIDNRTFGEDLVKMLGGKTLTKLARKGRLVDFLEKKEYNGVKLIGHLGGWMKQAMPLRGKRIVAYHKNWSYFTELFGIEIVDYMEPKPGIPPTPGHVSSVINKMKTQDIKVMFVANYFDIGKVKSVARKVDAIPVVTALAPGGEKSMKSFFDQFDIWITRLNDAFDKVSQ